MPQGDPFTALCRNVSRPRFAGRADLHLHTNFSDGSYSPAQVVDLARRSGLAALAITDHDTCAGLAHARVAADTCSGPDTDLEIIAGVEITTEFHGRELHLLGYFFDPEDHALQAGLAWLRTEREVRFHAMVDQLRRVGVPLEIETSDIQGVATLGRRHLACLLVKARQADTVQHAFQKFLGDRGRIQVPKKKMPVAQAIDLVRGAGGVAAWAHPSFDCTPETLAELRILGMEAVEVDYPSVRPGFKKNLRLWAKELNLAITGGSDCHGPDHPGRTLGVCGISAEELEVLRNHAGQTIHCR